MDVPQEEVIIKLMVVAVGLIYTKIIHSFNDLHNIITCIVYTTHSICRVTAPIANTNN